MCSSRILYAYVSKHECVTFFLSEKFNYTSWCFLHNGTQRISLFLLQLCSASFTEWMCLYSLILSIPLERISELFPVIFSALWGRGASFCLNALSSESEAARDQVQSEPSPETPLLTSLLNKQTDLWNLRSYFSCPQSKSHSCKDLLQLALFLKVSIML